MPYSRAVNKEKEEFQAPQIDGLVDTSFLAEELRREYRKSHEPVEVEFRKLVNWVRLGDQLTHQIHQYPAKLLPHIAHFFLHASTFRSEGGVVLDPFCGSGTVALESSIANRQAYVSDANPMALLITKVKTTPYDADQLVLEAVAIVKRAKRYRLAPSIGIVNADLWYSNPRKQQLEILLRAVRDVEDKSAQDFFLICFSTVARRLSAADPSISVPVRLKTKESFSQAINLKIVAHLKWISDADYLEEFSNVTLANIDRVLRANAVNPNRKSATVVGEDARLLMEPKGSERLKSASIPMVLTSPPYGSAQKYVRSTSLALNWLGLAGPQELSELEAKSIGREHVAQKRNALLCSLPANYESFLSQVKKVNPRREKISRQYLSDLSVAMSEMIRVAKSGGHIILIVGNNEVCGIPLTTDQFITDNMRSAGVDIDMHLIDKIKSRGLMTKRNTTASVISRESILVFKKR
ncbi:putative RNA methylase family UPF0020 [Variovorax sp. 54]|uniref:DNA methyltransferase n=1 Tax=Variovorax sp. 54 TaxID=2035212 RepID=UPI000C19328B|nr:DNA methyltransferase [Variovorax sp. 54]PIF76650.1 putative RNA methylase family UPF0020 [Variovorax sp. 54]